MTRRHRGIATLLALAAVALLGLTLVAISGAFSQDATRTRRLHEQAQVRQLLLAGMTIARARLNANAPLADPVALPAELAAQQALIELHEREPGIVDIIVRMADRRAGQRATFNWTDYGWALQDVQSLPDDQLAASRQ